MSILDRISEPVDDSDFDPRRAGLQHQELAAMYRKRYDKKLRATRLVAYLVTALGLVLFLGSFVLMFGARDAKAACSLSTLALIGFLVVVMGKLGLWVMSMKINTLKALKDVELQVAELADVVRAQAGTTHPPQGPPTTEPRESS